MPQHETHAARETPTTTRAQGDPWQAFGYIVGGVGFYGFVGYWLDRWWETSFAVVVGILVGAVLGIYLTVVRFGLTGSDGSPTESTRTSSSPRSSPADNGPARREQD